MKLTPPKNSTFLFALIIGVTSLACFGFGLVIPAYFLALAALVDLLAGNYFKGY
jgi:hypothetical protein